MIREILLFVIFIICSGCAHLSSDAGQEMNITVVDSKTYEHLEDFDCEIQASNGYSYHVYKSPEVLKVPKSNIGFLTCKEKDEVMVIRRGECDITFAYCDRPGQTFRTDNDHRVLSINCKKEGYKQSDVYAHDVVKPDTYKIMEAWLLYPSKMRNDSDFKARSLHYVISMEKQ